MVRVHSFVGLIAVTFVAVKSIDNLVVWMAEHREGKTEQLEFERRAAQMRRELIKELQEREASQ